VVEVNEMGLGKLVI